jgi:hypothetical protein
MGLLNIFADLLIDAAVDEDDEKASQKTGYGHVIAIGWIALIGVVTYMSDSSEAGVIPTWVLLAVLPLGLATIAYFFWTISD